MKEKEIKNTGRKLLPKGKKKVPLNAGYVREENKQRILETIRPIIERMDE